MDYVARLRNLKFIGNGSLLFGTFYVILAIATRSLSLTVIPGWSSPLLVYLPILVGILSIIWGVFNFLFDSKNPWTLGGKTALFGVIGSLLLIIGQIFIVIKESPVILYAIIGNGFLVFSCLFFALNFLFIHKQLMDFYLNKFISKKSNLYLFYGFLVQTLAYLIYFLSWFVEYETASQILNLIGMIVAGISIIGIAIGSFQLHLVLRNFQQIIMLQIQENMEEE